MRINFSSCALFTVLCALYAQGAHSATYYSGQNQAPQNRYNPTGFSPMYSPQPTMVGTNQNFRGQQQPQQFQNFQPSWGASQQQRSTQPWQQQFQQQTQQASQQSHRGFSIDAGIAHESAVWGFDMKKAGSSLHYDNVLWNTFSLNAGYGFDAGDMALKVGVGIKIGSQFGTSTMVDDDISNGGHITDVYYNPGPNNNGHYNPANGDELIGYFSSHALSIGKSSGGSLFGFNVGLGLMDKLEVGGVKLTPSLGYRSLSYTLKTNNNKGIGIEVLDVYPNCSAGNGDEILCVPAVIFISSGGNTDVSTNVGSNNLLLVPNGSATYDTSQTFFYSQPGTSHKYDVTWAGPYLALDADYIINANNAINGRIELGLPGYNAAGDQPYRWDWQHPKSVEDSAGIGSAVHIGLGANWLTAITDTIMLSVGFTYDYYSLSGADAKTYLNGTHWTNWYNDIIDIVFDGDDVAAFMDPSNPYTQELYYIEDLYAECPGWVCRAKSEVDSFYRSIGIRVGVSAKF
ncbi:MAG: hypothetical protein FWG80_03580 [Alphaproteobacteria bacterium]|nr:hypothetical protein [Alphaproteobacteria bacterium]